jgi:hypothetical protein
VKKKIAIHSVILSEHTGEETSWTDATTNPTVSPDFSGRLIQLKLFWAHVAVTSVLQVAHAKVESASFGGRTAIVTLSGSGLQTEPTPQSPVGIFNCDLPVETTKQLKVQFKHNGDGITPITSVLVLIGVFEG